MNTFFTRRNLAFIGYRGTGKSTIARLVANDLGFLRYDLDDEVQRLAGKSIAELFLQDGESYFRDLEQAALATLVLQGPSVLSLGAKVGFQNPGIRAQIVGVTPKDHLAPLQNDGAVAFVQGGPSRLV